MEFLIERLYGYFLLSSGVSIDTRTMGDGALFFALRGEKQSGAAFVEEAKKKGARCIVVDDPKLAKSPNCLYVPDTLEVLQRLAQFHRNHYKRQLIAITGTQGKTTLRRMLHHTLKAQYITHQSPHNYNNEIGVPLALLGILPQTEVAILELGANAVGEIQSLCAMAQPTHGVITRIGLAHLEGFGSEEGVFRAKKELFDYLDETGGVFFHNRAEPSLARLRPAHKAQINSFPDSTDAPTDPIAEPFLSCALPKPLSGRLETKLMGMHHYGLMTATWAVARHFGISPQEIRSALADFEPEAHRMVCLKTKHNTVIDDTYNASPDAMQAALDVMLQLRAQPKALILGDMGELGKYSQRLHRQLGERLQQIQSHFQLILLCGKEMRSAAQQCPSARYLPSPQALQQHLKQHPIRHHTCLLKASRSMELEQLIQYL